MGEYRTRRPGGTLLALTLAGPLYAAGTRPGATGHLATASVRWLDPATRAPHEESGQVVTGSLDDDLGHAPYGLHVAATAAYFAQSLRRADTGRGPLPGAPRPPRTRRPCRHPRLAHPGRRGTRAGGGDPAGIRPSRPRSALTTAFTREIDASSGG
ncbi:hypothetical protein ABZ876_21625 [Streptomyces sp. NPDC046931]|uniref:hypothetical protein n=1 Tax=Streptomyces sp. NPDC046931 TaxID=3154806 RepID=UPI0033BFE374